MTTKNVTTTPLAILIDTREQRPYAFPGFATISCALPTGDYSIMGHEGEFCVERKSLRDWLSTITHERARFADELARMAAMDRAYIVIEASWPAILAGDYERSHNILPAVVRARTLAIEMCYGIPVVMAGDRPAAREIVEELCERYAARAARRAIREAATVGVSGG